MAVACAIPVPARITRVHLDGDVDVEYHDDGKIEERVSAKRLSGGSGSSGPAGDSDERLEVGAIYLNFTPKF